ncbi:hypothetical protein [Kibdelosporangium aridum]|uniref:Uncharacterized protein n=1 Tax=Kibdelosporangium aridum TaxID=2030 RepID=A0A1W2EY56_KIBAR|nr:hypothetical protein [Kibdelosporangium aridum]SMD14637.1 hypothetical protein SAMN05661093_05089 [Kibdelosporangium aridum]
MDGDLIWPLREGLEAVAAMTSEQLEKSKIGPEPLDHLADRCTVLLDLIPTAILPSEPTEKHRMDAARRLLKITAFMSHEEWVRTAGSLLGLTNKAPGSTEEMSTDEIRDIWRAYKEEGGQKNKGKRDAPAHFDRFGREVRKIVGVHPLGKTHTWLSLVETDGDFEGIRRETMAFILFVDELCTYLDNEDGKLTKFLQANQPEPTGLNGALLDGPRHADTLTDSADAAAAIPTVKQEPVALTALKEESAPALTVPLLTKEDEEPASSSSQPAENHDAPEEPAELLPPIGRKQLATRFRTMRRRNRAAAVSLAIALVATGIVVILSLGGTPPTDDIMTVRFAYARGDAPMQVGTDGALEDNEVSWNIPVIAGKGKLDTKLRPAERDKFLIAASAYLAVTGPYPPYGCANAQIEWEVRSDDPTYPTSKGFLDFYARPNKEGFHLHVPQTVQELTLSATVSIPEGFIGCTGVILTMSEPKFARA